MSNTFPTPSSSTLFATAQSFLSSSTCTLSSFTTSDGLPLSTLSCAPSSKPNGETILFMTGWNESYIKYWEFLRRLTSQGYKVLTLDHRSQGFSGRTLSVRDVSHVSDFELYVSDASEYALSSFFGPAGCGAKISIIGHSMGGLVALKLAERLGTSRVHSVSTVAPMICFKTPPFPWAVAGVLGKVLPSLGLGEDYTVGFPKEGWEPELMNWPKECSHDVERNGCWARQQEKDPIVTLAGPSNTWVNAAWNACEG